MTSDVFKDFLVAVLREVLADEALRNEFKAPIREVLREQGLAEYLSTAEMAEKLGKSENAFRHLCKRNASLRELAKELPGGLGWKWEAVEQWVSLYGRNTHARKQANAEALDRLLASPRKR